MTTLMNATFAPVLALLNLPLLIAKVYIVGYALVVLCVLLGAAVILRPSRRKAPKKPES